jgi:hypothetical protein
VSWLAVVVGLGALACGESRRTIERGSGAASGSGGTNASSGGKGGTTGGTSTGGTGGGTLPDRCVTPEFQRCDAGTLSFYYSEATNECLPTAPDQCGSPVFPSLAACEAACPRAIPGLTACDHGYECAVVERGCCGACDPVSVDDLAAANALRDEELVGCDGPIPPCEPCASVDEQYRTRQDFIAECLQGTCTLVDLRLDAATECLGDRDCFIRDGADCCQQCDGGGLVALSSTNFLSDLCEPEQACGHCVSDTSRYSAVCAPDSQRCVVLPNPRIPPK